MLRWTSLLLTIVFVALPAGLGVRPTSASTEPPSDDATSGRSPDPSAIAPAVFPHDAHVNEMGIECVECHHETNAAPLSIPHREYFGGFWIDCKICHHEAGAPALSPQRCSICHHSAGRDSADETLSSKVVIHQKCWSCHDVGTGAEAGASCAGCHPGGKRDG
jgi:hypothetical protein